MTYTTLLKTLFEINQKGLKLGLDVMLRLDALLGFPSSKFLSIHIAGTNGKGSTTTKIAKALELSNPNLKIGLYTSPHISSFRERIKINSAMISENKVEELLQEIFRVANSNQLKPTFFELTTLLCFLYFAEENVDVAVIETGLGGRLDATNILNPIMTVITGIDFDHQHILGSTLEEIALEKAGIIKNRIPLVAGPKAHRIKAIQEVAKSKEAPYFFVADFFEDYELENQAVARMAIEILSRNSSLSLTQRGIEEGLFAKPPCRFEERVFEGKKVIFDVGHNPDGLRSLFLKVKKQFPLMRLKVVTGMSKDKDLKESLSVIAAYADEVYLTQAKSARAASIRELKAYVRPSMPVISYPNPKECILTALKEMDQDQEVVIVCGTFFIMQEIRQALCIDEVVDPWLLQENSLQTFG